MANTHSAEKYHRKTLKRTARNASVRSSVKTAVKKAREAIAAGDQAKAKEAVRLAASALNKAASKGVLHARNAERRIARIAHAATVKFARAAK